MNPAKRAADSELTSDVSKSAKLSEGSTTTTEPSKPVASAPTTKPDTILDYLATLSVEDLNALYIDPFTVMTVFRSLPPIAKQIVLRLVTLTHAAVPQSELRAWAGASADNKQGRKDFKDGFQRLIRLRVLQSNLPGVPLAPPFHDAAFQSKKEVSFSLNTHFQRCLLQSLANLSLESDAQGQQSDSTGHASVSELKAYSEDKWRHMLQWMFGQAGDDLPPRSVMRRLVEMNLIARPKDRFSPHLTDRLGKLATLGAKTMVSKNSLVLLTELGVQFALKPRRNQAWELALHYLESLSRPPTTTTTATSSEGTATTTTTTTTTARPSHAEALKFVFRLAFLPVGPAIAASDQSAEQVTVMHEQAEQGFVRINHDNTLFHHTPLLQYQSTPPSQYPSSLTRQPGQPTPSAVAAASLHDEEILAERFLVVETTLKVFGLTSDPLLLAMLSLFADLRTRLPNMAMGFLTRGSVRRALLNGLSAEAIVAWIESHAHPRMVRTALGSKDATGRRVGGTDWLVPANVTNQIRLWNEERNRLSGRNAVIIDNFSAEPEFLQWFRFATERNTVLFADMDKQVLVVTEDGLKHIKEEKERAQKDAQRAVQL